MYIKIEMLIKSGKWIMFMENKNNFENNFGLITINIKMSSFFFFKHSAILQETLRLDRVLKNYLILLLEPRINIKW